ncbi:MAG TPA: hypothetical protein VLZ11_03780 [Flavobacterium sp.]|nr:hypothetical protein [Flavobacterium sp.]
MAILFSYRLYFFLALGLTFNSCYDSKADDYSAYFGGEVVNPKNKWMLFYKGDQLLDSIPLDKDNRFFKKFDSLTPGLYSFKHEPEFQYVYFDKNDSIMVRLNTYNFDESVVFCGKGDEKNNFLIEVYLKNQVDKSSMFPTFDLDESGFTHKADSSHQAIVDFYTTQKEAIQWNEEFDLIAKASVDYPYYTKREFYPVAHKRRNQKQTYAKLSGDYYNHRKSVDFDNPSLSNFWPYFQYINTFIDNLANEDNNGFFTDSKTVLKKLKIADSITQNEWLKNKISNTIAIRYLTEKESNYNDKEFLENYYKISTDTDKKDEVKSLVEAIELLNNTGYLPQQNLKDKDGKTVSSNTIFTQKTIVYFWTKRYENHFFAVHKKLNALLEKRPELNVIGICLDSDFEDQKVFWEKNKTNINPEIQHYWPTDLNELKSKWAVINITRATVVDKNGKISKAFVNIFDTTFSKEL